MIMFFLNNLYLITFGDWGLGIGVWGFWVLGGGG